MYVRDLHRLRTCMRFFYDGINYTRIYFMSINPEKYLDLSIVSKTFKMKQTQLQALATLNYLTFCLFGSEMGGEGCFSSPAFYEPRHYEMLRTYENGFYFGTELNEGCCPNTLLFSPMTKLSIRNGRKSCRKPLFFYTPLISS